MEKFGGERYNSRWDWTTWLILTVVIAACICPWFFDDGIWPGIICLVMLGLVLLTFIGIYYKIDGGNLIVYTFFVPTAYPIDKIKEVKSTTSVLSAPATSLTHRLAITFTDRSVLKSSMPILISPVRQEEFIRQMLAINPKIQTPLGL